MIHLPEVPAGPPIAVSASLYVAYRQCPDAALARLEGHYGPDSRPSFKGMLAHQVFARHLETGPIEDADFTQVCRESVGSSNLNFKLGSLKMKPSELRSVIEETKALYDRFRTLPGDGFRGAECSIEFEAQHGVTLRGRVDAIFDDPPMGGVSGVRLVDWKTGDIGAPEDQLLFYAVLWTLDQRSMPRAVEAISVRTGERFRLDPTEEDLQTTANQIGEVVAALRAGMIAGRRLARHGGPWCRYCPLLDECSEGRAAEALANGRPLTAAGVSEISAIQNP